MATKAEVKEVRGIAVQFGRALMLTIVAAESEERPDVDDMNEAWTVLADKIIAFAEEG